MSQQRWVPWAAYSGTVLVGLTTIAVSGLWLTHLAGLIGMAGPLAVSLPVTVDAGGAVGTVLWLTGPTRQARTWGKAVAMGALSASIVGNVLAHLIELGMLPVSALLVVGVSAVYPTTCWLMVHLLVLTRAGQKAPAGKKAAAAPAKSAAPKPTPTPAAPVALHAVTDPPASKKTQARDWFFDQVAAGRDPAEIKPAEVDKAIGASGYAKKFIATWRDEATTTPAVAVNE